MARSAALVAGAAIVSILVAWALVALVWTPYPPGAIDIVHAYAGPSSAHWLGQDAYGRDVASMLMAGSVQTLAVSLLAVGLGAGLGVPAGLLAAARGGWVDGLLMRASDVAFAFPALLTAVMLTALAGPGAINAVVAIGLFAVPVFARVTRAVAAVVWRHDFVLAARVAGRSDLAIAWEHVLPNVLPALLVQASLQLALAIVADAGLAYVGLGTRPPLPSWGRMLNDAQTAIFRAPQLALMPGAAIALAVLGFNLLGDGLQDALDPRRRR